jgi:putative redox protein
MDITKINIKRTNNDFKLEATNENGNLIIMDASEANGGSNSGFRPMQLLLSAIGGCSAIDVISILKKQKQVITDFEIEVEGDREKIEDYSLWRKIVLHFIIKGEVEPEKANKAVKLSLDKYCSVSKTLEPTATINYKLTVNGSLYV